MTISFTLTENDYLTYFLYRDALSRTNGKQKTRSRIVGALGFAMLAYLFYENGIDSAGHIFMSMALIWLLFYTAFQKNSNKNHYLAFIREHYKFLLGQATEVKLGSDAIVIKDRYVESSISYEGIAGIIESG